MRKVFLFVFLVTMPLLAVCQQDYAVTLRGDTLRGEVRILTYDMMDRVQVITLKGKESFTAVQIRMVSIEGKTYQPVKIDTNIRMMQLLTPGFLSLYGFRMNNQMTYDGRYLVKLGGRSMELPNLTFKKTMAAFLEECPAVVEKISSGTWTKKHLDSILVSYNACVAERSIPAKPNEGLVKLNALKQKIEASDLANKKDALDIVSDLSQKVGKKESVPNYLIEGLKSYLNGKPELAADLDEVLKIIKN